MPQRYSFLCFVTDLKMMIAVFAVILQKRVKDAIDIKLDNDLTV